MTFEKKEIMKHLFIVLGLLSINLNIMGAEINTQIIINSTPEKVWAVLTTFSEYKNWNPFILSIDGEIEEGKKIKVVFKEMTFKPKLKRVEENKNFEWLGHLLIPGIFDGRHKFELIDNGDGTTTFIQSEKFSGFLVTILKKKLIREYTPKFESMNVALKKRVEQ